jgi:hypothetical protein
MPQRELFILMGIGGLFIIIGLGAILWGKTEEKRYYNSLTNLPDSREFLEGWPKRPQFGSLQIGGWIAIVMGLLMVIIGCAFSLWG